MTNMPTRHDNVDTVSSSAAAINAKDVTTKCQIDLERSRCSVVRADRNLSSFTPTSKCTPLKRPTFRNKVACRVQILSASAQGHWRLSGWLASTSPASSTTAHRHRYRKEVNQTQPRQTVNTHARGYRTGTQIKMSNLLQRTSCLAEWALLDARPRPPLTLWRTPVAIFNCAAG